MRSGSRSAALTHGCASRSNDGANAGRNRAQCQAGQRPAGERQHAAPAVRGRQRRQQEVQPEESGRVAGEDRQREYQSRKEIVAAALALEQPHRRQDDGDGGHVGEQGVGGSHEVGRERHDDGGGHRRVPAECALRVEEGEQHRQPARQTLQQLGNIEVIPRQEADRVKGGEGRRTMVELVVVGAPVHHDLRMLEKDRLVPLVGLGQGNDPQQHCQREQGED